MNISKGLSFNNMADVENKKDSFENYGVDSLKGYDYPFTNIVMEGGGSKGMAYVVALEV